MMLRTEFKKLGRMADPSKVRTPLEAGAGEDVAALSRADLIAEVTRLRAQMAQAESYATEFDRQRSELLEAKELAELASRSKTEFVANMSHELRTPLNAIIGFAEVLTKEMLGPLGDAKYREYANDILSSGKHLFDLISDILDISVIESGQLILRKEVINVGGIFRTSEAMVRDRARDGGINLSVHLPQNLPVLFGDSLRVKQMILNLLSNALKFTPRGGDVALIAEGSPEGGAMIRVRDTGIGIAPDDVEKVLKPFTQVDGSHQRRYEGTGLGLYLTKSIAQAHGGDVKVESELGTGTTVTLIFPPVALSQ